MLIKCANNISHAGVNGQKAQGATGEEQNLCLDDILGSRWAEYVFSDKNMFSSGKEISRPSYLY